MTVALTWLALLLSVDSASAHEGHLHWDGLENWTWDLRIIVPLGVSAGLHAVGVSRLWRRAGLGRGVRFWQAGSFFAGWLLLLGALMSPLHWLGERLFTAHMVEHQLLMLAAAPLLVVARPLGGVLWALPQSWRKAWGAFGRKTAMTYLWRTITGPLTATVIHGVAIWVWHVPDFYAAALASEWVHWVQHLSFLLSALLFWWAILCRRERGYGIGIFCLFVTAIHTSFLGILITWAKAPLYPTQTEAAPSWGLTQLEDQQLAGLIMWVPGGALYGAAVLALAGLWITWFGSHGHVGPSRAASLG
jgi:cytochrome c oxidase assembly factor CtaG